MKPIFGILVTCLILLTPDIASGQNDSTGYIQVEGTILDSRTGDPMVYARVYIAGTGIGTIANQEGQFILKIPAQLAGESVVVSSIGYENKVMTVEQLRGDPGPIMLAVQPIELEEVTIIGTDARKLLEEALGRIEENYCNKPLMLTAFYRENIRKRKKYVSISEAVLEAYKSPYNNYFEIDKVSILKARKGNDLNSRDTVILKLQGGPMTTFQLDFVKYPYGLLDRDVLDYYHFSVNGMITLDGRSAFVISFEQTSETDLPFYEGRIYVNVEDLAILGAEYHLTKRNIKNAREFMVQKEPPGSRIDITSATYQVYYRHLDNFWMLSSVRSEINLEILWDDRTFSSNYTVRAEMVVTDLDSLHISKLRDRPLLRNKDVFVEKVEDFQDPEFWGAYNIIHPEEDLRTAIRRIGLKMKED